jgi:hypothetical protein
MSVQRSCRIVRLSRAAYYRPPRSAVERDAPVIAALNAVVEREAGPEGLPLVYKPTELRFMLERQLRSHHPPTARQWFPDALRTA